jgi:hypothetical protein
VTNGSSACYPPRRRGGWSREAGICSISCPHTRSSRGPERPRLYGLAEFYNGNHIHSFWRVFASCVALNFERAAPHA